MVEPPADVSANGSPESPEPGPIDVESIGVRMSEQFLEIVGLWTQQLGALAEAGIDPTPLVQALARTLRTAADKLDPGGAAAG
jgi:hypothetical protein